MVNYNLISVEEIASEVKDNSLLGIPADYSGVPMSVTVEIIKKRSKNKI